MLKTGLLGGGCAPTAQPQWFGQRESTRFPPGKRFLLVPRWAPRGRGRWPQGSSSPGFLQGPPRLSSERARGTRATGRLSLYPPLPTKPPHRPLGVSLGTALSRSLPSILQTALRGGYCLHTQRGQHLLKRAGPAGGRAGVWGLSCGSRLLDTMYREVWEAFGAGDARAGPPRGPVGSRPRAAQAEECREGGWEPQEGETVPMAAGWGRASEPGLQGVNLTTR